VGVSRHSAARIYNLFPRLAGPMDKWPHFFDRARELGFRWVYINPFHYPGFSGSLYAVKDYFRLNPLFVPRTWGQADDQRRYLSRLVSEASRRGLALMMDLVINHTAKDSLLVEEHPEWFVRDADGRIKSPSAIDPADARRVTVWGDLAEVNNRDAPNREELWAFWEYLVAYYAEVGFRGFRCDAAYQVPAELWRRLIRKARSIDPQCLFFAETLGCRLEEVQQLAEAGFDLIANSSKWWNFSEPWCLEQHRLFRSVAPSVSFPESHDTPRLASETGGLQCVQEQRYVFAAAFSGAVLMPVGYELGFRRKLDVVNTKPEDWEEPLFDISGVVRALNDLKARIPVLGAEGRTEAVWGLEGPVLCLRKEENGQALLIVVNKDWHNAHDVAVGDLDRLLPGPERTCLWPQEAPRPTGSSWSFRLGPAEVALLAAS